MTKEQIKTIEDKVVSELGNEFDVDMLSCTLSEMNLSDNDAFICAGYFLGDVYDTFEYNGKVLDELREAIAAFAPMYRFLLGVMEQTIAEKGKNYDETI